MPDHALNAAMMLQVMRDRMQRDPEKVKQKWQFIWRADRQVPHDELVSQIEYLSHEVGETIGSWMPPTEDLNVDRDEANAGYVTSFTMTVKSKMNEQLLTEAHQHFAKVAPERNLEYAGCRFFVKDPRFDAKEMFAYERSFNERMLSTTPHCWCFTFEGECDDPDGITQFLASSLFETANLRDENELEASILVGESTEGLQIAIIKIVAKTTFLEEDLAKNHKTMKKLAKKAHLQYKGVEIVSAESLENIPPASSDVLSHGQNTKWINEIVGATCKFKVESLPSVANKMRKIHLQKLADIGMLAADWMPTADQRLANQLRPKSEIIKKLMATYITSAWVCAPADVVSNDEIKSYLATNQLKRNSFSDKETGWMQTKRAEANQFSGQAGWLLENIWSLAWLLGAAGLPTPNISSDQTSHEVMGPIRDDLLGGLDKTFDQLMSRTKLRRLESVIALEDLMYCAHNSVRTVDIPHGGLIHERRQSLTWALSPGVRWDDTDVST